MIDEQHKLFCKGNTFYMGVNVPPHSDQTLLEYDAYTYRGISDGQFAELEFVMKEGRIGVFLLESASDYPSKFLYKAEAFPFLYDEVWMPDFTVTSNVYLVVRIGRQWGVIRLFQRHSYDVIYKGWCVPWKYTSRTAAIAAIPLKPIESKYKWVKIDVSESNEEE